MISARPFGIETEFLDHKILEQLKKICDHPVFAVSAIMSRFLFFIVEETLAGRSHTIKEYTIGIKVLNKPLGFNPQTDAIVRIHASRLRRALHLYYHDVGAKDGIHISMPRGGYVPVFSSDGVEMPDEIYTIDKELVKVPSLTPLAVLPFFHFEKSTFRSAFVDGLGMQISSELTHFKTASVISYYTMHNLAEKKSSVKELASETGVKFLITGSMQSQKDRIRVTISLITTYSQEQSWSEIYDRKLNVANVFEIQEEIVKDSVSKIAEYLNLAV